MKKKFYIIPGFEETTEQSQYRKLASMLEKKGYEVINKNVNWNQKLSEQFFAIENDSIIFGFSLGSVLARLIVQDYSCQHLILASMTPLPSFKEDKIMREALTDLLGINFVNDVEKHLKNEHKAKKQTILYGDQEEESADVLVPNTNHKINDAYIKEIEKLI